MPYQSIEVRPAAGSLGADVCGVDLARPLRNSTADELRRALVEHLVLFFRDQNLTQAQHVAFGRQFGTPTPAHPTLPAAFPDFPEILQLGR